MAASDSRGSIHIATLGSQRGEITVLLQPVCVTILQGRSDNGLDMGWDQAKALGKALVAAAERGLALQGVIAEE